MQVSKDVLTRTAQLNEIYPHTGGKHSRSMIQHAVKACRPQKHPVQERICAKSSHEALEIAMFVAIFQSLMPTTRPFPCSVFTVLAYDNSVALGVFSVPDYRYVG